MWMRQCYRRLWELAALGLPRTISSLLEEVNKL